MRQVLFTCYSTPLQIHQDQVDVRSMNRANVLCHRWPHGAVLLAASCISPANAGPAGKLSPPDFLLLLSRFNHL